MVSVRTVTRTKLEFECGDELSIEFEDGNVLLYGSLNIGDERDYAAEFSPDDIRLVANALLKAADSATPKKAAPKPKAGKSSKRKPAASRT